MPSIGRVLIDTHVFLWMATTPEMLSPRALLACESSDLLLSVASVWEIAIKHESGKLPLPAPLRRFLDRHIRAAGVELLPIGYLHSLRAAALPPHHKDPFDRMIAAQSLEEKLPCVTSDPNLARYNISALW